MGLISDKMFRERAHILFPLSLKIMLSLSPEGSHVKPRKGRKGQRTLRTKDRDIKDINDISDTTTQGHKDIKDIR